MSAAPDAVVVLTTVASPEAGAALARALVERRLAACGTLLPGARSIYRWQGALADEVETVLLLKTRPALLPALKAAFATLHPYAVPELLALPVADGLAPYLAWLGAETAPESTPEP